MIKKCFVSDNCSNRRSWKVESFYGLKCDRSMLICRNLRYVYLRRAEQTDIQLQSILDRRTLHVASILQLKKSVKAFHQALHALLEQEHQASKGLDSRVEAK